MSERSEYSPGEFCWVDVSVPDPEAGARFYADLVGWEWQAGGAETGGYGIFNNAGKVVAGMGPTQAPDQPPAWGSYVNVEDADATAAKIVEAGGTAMAEPFDVLDAGRMGVFADPQGAVFCIWQPRAMTGAQLVNEPGSWIWTEYSCPDLEAAERFYGAVFGWSLQGSDEAGSEEDPYYAWHAEGQRWEEGIAGASAGEAARWLPYIAVESAANAVATTTGAGGEVLIEPLVIPVGTMAVLKDPQGAEFGALEPDFPEER